MNILDRYFLKEFLRPLVVCLVAFLMCMVVYDLYDSMNDFIEAKTSLGNMLRYYCILLPAWIVDIMPIALLLSLLYVLSNMSKHGELTAMRVSGLDIMRLMTPYFIIGACVSMQMLSLNLAWAPNALQRAKELREKSTRKSEDAGGIAAGVTYRDIGGNRFWTITYLNAREKRATGIEITQCDETGRDLRKISAEKGSYRQGFWTLQNVLIYDYTLPVSSANVVRQLKVLKARELIEEPAKFILQAKKTKRMTTRELIVYLGYSKRLPPKYRAMYSTELQNRLAFPLANFVVFLIGVPFGVVGQRRSNFMAVVNALAFYFIYYFFFVFMIKIGSLGRVGPWFAAWFPNGVFSIAGLWMIVRIR